MAALAVAVEQVVCLAIVAQVCISMVILMLHQDQATPAVAAVGHKTVKLFTVPVPGPWLATVVQAL